MAKPSWRIWALAARKVRARSILLEKVLGDGFAGFVVAGEEVEGFAFPAPVLHDLGGEFDEVPGDVGAGEDFTSTRLRTVVEEVAELVEDGFDFAVSEQGGFAAEGRR